MFIILWEYVVAEGQEVEFEKIYGADGDWAQPFKRARGYLGTDLLRDPRQPRRYVTIDRWNSTEEFDSFQEIYRAEYEAKVISGTSLEIYI